MLDVSFVKPCAVHGAQGFCEAVQLRVSFVTSRQRFIDADDRLVRYFDGDVVRAGNECHHRLTFGRRVSARPYLLRTQRWRQGVGILKRVRHLG